MSTVPAHKRTQIHASKRDPESLPCQFLYTLTVNLKKKKAFLKGLRQHGPSPSGLARLLQAKLSELEMDERARPLLPRGKQTKEDEKTLRPCI